MRIGVGGRHCSTFNKEGGQKGSIRPDPRGWPIGSVLGLNLVAGCPLLRTGGTKARENRIHAFAVWVTMRTRTVHDCSIRDETDFGLFRGILCGRCTVCTVPSRVPPANMCVWQRRNFCTTHPGNTCSPNGTVHYSVGATTHMRRSSRTPCIDADVPLNNVLYIRSGPLLQKQSIHTTVISQIGLSQSK